MQSDLKALADAMEKLAFEMPAPNEFTPRFVQLAVAARSLALHQAARPEERENVIREVVTVLATWGMDSGAMNYACSLLEHFGLPLEPTFKVSKLQGGTEVIELVSPPQSSGS